MTAEPCLHQLLRERASQWPERIAVQRGESSLTYAELDAAANGLAHELRRQGVGPDRLVGLLLGRDLSLVVGMLGILRAGGAYVPIDPDYPRARTEYLLRDSGISVVVTDRLVGAVVDGLPGTIVDASGFLRGAPVEPPPVDVAPSNLAYAIYTSGTTGEPKGVLVEHRNVTRLFTRTLPWFELGPTDVWTMFHSPSFDFSVWEIWGALLHGGRLVLVDEATARSPAAFRELLLEQRVTILNQTPSAFAHLVREDLRHAPRLAEHLRTIVFGGEALRLESLRTFVERYGDESPALVNMYGITETTVHVTYRRLAKADLDPDGRGLLGVPIPDLDVELLDERGQPVPTGEVGEIHVGGAGVARGYHGRPALTAERFVSRDGRRYYRSGDRAIRRADGSLDYVGRADAQLKVRGYRIEPGEVEASLELDPRVHRAVVVARDHGDADVRLIGLVQPRGELPGDPAQAARLAALVLEDARARLPAHLCPSRLQLVAELPLTAHGKLDRSGVARLAAALGEPEAGSARDGDPTSPQTAVLHIGREILGYADVGPDDDLFEAGATSLALVRILGRINERFGTSVVGTDLEGLPTMQQIAHRVELELRTRQPKDVT